MTQFKATYFGRSNPCPICGGKTDCRQNRETGIIHCKRVDQSVNGFRYVGTDGIGFFMHVVDAGSKGHTVIPFPIPQKREAKQPEEKQLSYFQRGIENGKLSEQLTLDSESIAWLKKKGLPKEAAIRFGFKSYTHETRVSGLSPLLPGVHPQQPTRLLPARQSGGLLIPMRDIDGQVLGWQRVCPDRITAELSGAAFDGAKYTWFSSDAWKGGRPILPEPYAHLPLGYFQPETLNPAYADALILAEGGVKSAIASEVGGLRMLATPSGGQFSKDGKPYRQLVETIKNLNLDRVILAPDAGMLENPGIARAYFNDFRAMESLDIELQVLWWGQTGGKQYPDIDGLTIENRLHDAQTITFDEYFRLQGKDIQEKLDKSRAAGFKVRVRRQAPISKATPVNVESRREEMRNEMMQVIRYGEPGTLHVWVDGCGMGKSTQMMSVIAEAAREKWLRGRKLAVTKTTDEAKALQRSLGKDAVFMGGRSADKESPFYCRELKTFEAIAAAGHDATTDHCINCAANLEAQGIQCPFIQAGKRAQEAKVVTATYSSFLGDSKRLDNFNFIVVDESLHGAGLTEQKTLTTEILTAWKQGIMDHCPTNYPRRTHPIWPVFDALQDLLNRCTELEQNQNIDAGSAFVEAYGSSDLSALYQAEWPEQAKGKAFIFEELHRKKSPWGGYDLDMSRLQKRLLVDLLEALTDGTQRADLTRAGIVFERQRASVDILKRKLVVNLDATPALDLLRDMWADKVETYGQGGVPNNVNITQVSGSLYSPNIMRGNPAQIQKLGNLVKCFSAPFNAPLIVGPKGLVEPDEQTQKAVLNSEHPNAEVIWYGNQTRAANNYQHCDALILAGCHQPPMDAIRRKVNALRASKPSLSGVEKVPVGIAITGDSFSVPGREQHQNADPLVQSVMDNAIYSEVVQAIGRLRPLTRQGQTFEITYISSMVLKDVPMDTVIEGRDILDPDRIKAKRPHLTEKNQHKADEARQKVATYLQANPGAGVNEVHRATGVRKPIISELLKSIPEPIPTGDNIPVLNTNITMMLPAGIESVRGFQGSSIGFRRSGEKIFCESRHFRESESPLVLAFVDTGGS